jgi:hypothetical protein
MYSHVLLPNILYFFCQKVWPENSAGFLQPFRRCPVQYSSVLWVNFPRSPAQYSALFLFIILLFFCAIFSLLRIHLFKAQFSAVLQFSILPLALSILWCSSVQYSAILQLIPCSSLLHLSHSFNVLSFSCSIFFRSTINSHRPHPPPSNILPIFCHTTAQYSFILDPALMLTDPNYPQGKNSKRKSRSE